MAPASVRACLIACLVGGGSMAGAEAALYTPPEWQQQVHGQAGSPFTDQRKHTNWIRDRNANFIDDLIDQQFSLHDTVDVVIELNECYPTSYITQRFSGHGRIEYIPYLVSSVLLSDVPVAELDSMAAYPEVAMVEWKTPLEPTMDVATRAVQARSSSFYANAPAPGAQGTRAGSGVNIAIVDYGVADWYETFKNADGSRAFVAGFDAMAYTDASPANGIDDSCEDGRGCVEADGDDEPGDGTRNPDPATGQNHATKAAGMALGRATGDTCRDGSDDTIPPNCTGTAPGAGLIDVRVADDEFFIEGTGKEHKLVEATADVFEGLDWIARKAVDLKIHVVSLSLCDNHDDAGTSALSVTVDALVALGVTVVVSHGNSTNAGVAQGTQLTGSPGSASSAITVGGIKDQGTVNRADDQTFSMSLKGPRSDCTGAYTSCDPGALKPDITAPAEDLTAVSYTTTTATTPYVTLQDGTSFAAPIVAGAAAIVKGARPDIDPGSLKALLKRTADRQIVGFPSTEDWDPLLGSGELDVWNAVKSVLTLDVRFESCTEPATPVGHPCHVDPPLYPWLNTSDILTDAPPRKGVSNNITARVHNDGALGAEVDVVFTVSTLGMGLPVFQAIGVQHKVIPAGSMMEVPQPWTPLESGHHCLQVQILYPFDSDYRNNLTQRNIEIAPSEYTVRVGNPLHVPAQFHLVTSSSRAGWECTANLTDFNIDPYRDCPREVHVTFRAPRGALPGESADCQVVAYATRTGYPDSVLIGGVTVRTFVPEPCRLVGQVIDRHGHPIRGVRIRFSVVRSPETLRPSWERDRTVVTDRDGVFDLSVLPALSQRVMLEHPKIGRGEIVIRPPCGVGTLLFELTPSGVRLLRER